MTTSRQTRSLEHASSGSFSDPAGTLASFAANLRFEDIPAEVSDLLKQRVLDTLACAMAGSAEAPIPALLDYARASGGTTESRVWVFGDRVPAAMAAFVNGPMARALDLGDCHPEGQHLSEYILPSLLALAEARGRVSGRELIAALCAGGEVQSRIGNACLGLSGMAKYQRITNYTQWGAICAAGRLLDLDTDKMWNAIGIGYSILGSGDLQCIAEGNHMMRVKHAFTCADAVHCARLAQAGVTGTRNVFLGPRGFLATNYFHKNDPAALTAALGAKWEWLDSMTKGFACCYGAHAGITGVLQLMADHGISASDMETIECGLHPAPFGLVAEPQESKWNPRTAIEAQFSLPFCVATAAVSGRLMAKELLPDEMARPDIRSLMTRIKAHKRPADTETFSGSVAIVTKSGKEYRTEVDHPYGSPGNPLGWAGETEKFRNCCALSARPISEKNIEATIDACRNLEKLDDVSKLIDLVVAQ
ncbi:MAG: MmgE/PrpD family protein [Burkholderiales bacterium]|nr:MmgE/PrpD family protein [Burkholderiales bacterium]